MEWDDEVRRGRCRVQHEEVARRIRPGAVGTCACGHRGSAALARGVRDHDRAGRRVEREMEPAAVRAEGAVIARGEVDSVERLVVPVRELGLRDAHASADDVGQRRLAFLLDPDGLVGREDGEAMDLAAVAGAEDHDGEVRRATGTVGVDARDRE